MFTATNPPAVNSIVRGAVCGCFLVLGTRIIGGEWFAQLKAVNPADHSQTAPGELALPFSRIESI